MTKDIYEIRTGTRAQPGDVVQTFAGDFKCGGPATACLRAFSRLAYTRGKRNDFVGFFRKVA